MHKAGKSNTIIAEDLDVHESIIKFLTVATRTTLGKKLKSSYAKTIKKCHLKFSSKIIFFLSGAYIYVQLFHSNCIENDLYIAISVLLLNLNMKMLILDENVRWHLEAFASELLNCKTKIIRVFYKKNSNSVFSHKKHLCCLKLLCGYL